MGLIFNGTTIPENTGVVEFNGSIFTSVWFNGTEFWKKDTGVITPVVPDFCNASDGDFDDHVLIQWGYSEQDVIYKIFRDGIEVGTSAEDLWYEDYTVVSETVYDYYVTACYEVDDTICSGPSETDPGNSAPAIPIGEAPAETPGTLTASYKIFWDSINVTWTNGTETTATAVNIYRNDIFIERIPFGLPEYRDGAVDEGSEYTYTAAFWNVWGEGPMSTPSVGALKDGDFVPDHKHEPVDLLSQGHQDGLGIDADMLDGEHGDFYSPTTHTHTCSDVGAPCGSWDFVDGILYITIPTP